MASQKQIMSHQDLPTTRFERVFFRYVAWFPILTLPMLVWELMETGQTGMGLIIAIVHAVLVFRFVSVNNVPGWFKKKGS
ncbi:MAG: hypothetical protein VX474_04560 [Pseudomonadota bacterium]|nr:hypothetical protein [Pseudomonadota bacterium]MEC8103163.1 hypothetical protein [Pseudomonadota bacterium]MEC8522868.1 hypothetical protein [Pseudomonadota bacterium]MEE2749224.1 hypothetical protein [Pseudomonadota bacterium]